MNDHSEVVHCIKLLLLGFGGGTEGSDDDGVLW